MVLAGKEYGSGSSRDWAAKGTLLLGVRAVIAESYERIHRSNLVGMGVLPLEFLPGQTPESLGLTGPETFDIDGYRAEIRAAQAMQVRAREDGGKEKTFEAGARGYAGGSGLLPARRDFAVRAAADAVAESICDAAGTMANFCADALPTHHHPLSLVDATSARRKRYRPARM